MTAGLHEEWLQICETAERTASLGAALGRLLTPGDVLCLSGELGAGKTVFSRGIGAGWGATVPLTSPTYNLAHEHERQQDRARLYHLDFYRISCAREAETWASMRFWTAAISSSLNGPSAFWSCCRPSVCGSIS